MKNPGGNTSKHGWEDSRWEFPGREFSGGNLPGGSSMGGIFPSENFLGGSFPNTSNDYKNVVIIYDVKFKTHNIGNT